MNLNNTCIHNVSDEDCNKCMIRGILPKCPEGCKDYNRGNRKTKPEYMNGKTVDVIDNNPSANKKGLRIKVGYVVLDENNNLVELGIDYSGYHCRGGGIVEVAQRNKFPMPEY